MYEIATVTRDTISTLDGGYKRKAATRYFANPLVAEVTFVGRGGDSRPFRIPRPAEVVHIMATSGRWGKSSDVRFGSECHPSILADRKHAEEQAAKAEQDRIGAIALADALRPILGGDEEGKGWMAHSADVIEMTHSFALERCTDCRERLLAAGFRLLGGGCLGLYSATQKIGRIE